MFKRLSCALLFVVTHFSFSQETCTYGTVSNLTTVGENTSTGGSSQYAGAVDFDIPFGTTFTVTQVKFNVLKGPAALQYVNVAFMQEQNGMPGNVIEEFLSVVPSSQTLAYSMDDIDPFMDSYQITVDLPTQIVLQKGKYFMRMSAAPGDSTGAWWEITNEGQAYGAFDFIQVDNNPWGGAGYYSKVFQVLGSCSDSGEVMPDYGDVCAQENLSNDFETAMPFIFNGQLLSIADDFIVPENTTFHLTDFTINAMLLGGGMHNATINIRNSNNGAPGAVLQSYINKGVSSEEFHGYWPFPGLPVDVASIHINFSFKNDPVALTAGQYFIEVLPTPFITDFINWEATSQEGIGDYSYISADGGVTWVQNEGYQQVFKVEGFCNTNLSTDNQQASSSIVFYPNPVKDILQIVSQKSPVRTLTVYDIQGREVNGYKFDHNTVQMEFLASGIYLIKMQFENGSSETFKVVKE